MRLRAFFRLSLLVATAHAALAATPTSWEAESGRVSGQVTPLTDAKASNGAALHLGRTGRVEWTVETAVAGRYELNFRYRTVSEAKWPKLAVNDRVRGFGLTSTFGEWHESAVVVTLRAGANTIALDSTDTRKLPEALIGFDLDMLRFTVLPNTEIGPLYEIPEISPRQARVDLRAPQPLMFLLRRNGHAVAHVTLAGQELAPEYADYAAVEDAVQMTIPASALAAVPAGRHTLHVAFADGAEIKVPVEAGSASLAAPLLIASIDVSHGKATLLRLPDGQIVLIDCAQPVYAESHVLPFLTAHGIKRIDHLIITHYHDDHVGGLELLKSRLTIGTIHDYKSYRTGETFQLGGAEWFVLNAYDAGDDENSRSLALQVTYRGFVYSDGADNYGLNQRLALEKFPGRVRSHVYYGNHHFHGSVDVNYLRRTDPVLFLISAEAAVYARAAYAEHFVKEVDGYLKAHHGRLRESLLTAETGNTLIRVHDAGRWTYETLPIGAVFPDFLSPSK